MKKILCFATVLALCMATFLCIVSCDKPVDAEGLWKDAKYTSDTTLGEGEKTFAVEVKVEDKTVKFTINTNADTVGAALLENDLIAGEMGEFGMYIKSVNGITADYDVDQSYWAFWIGGEYAMSGVDTTPINESETYLLEYTK